MMNIFKNKKYVIFDMDGTLIDSVGVWNSVDEALIKELNNGNAPDASVIQSQRDEMLRKFRNSPHPYNDYCDFLRIKYNLNVSAKEIIERRYAIAQYYLENVVDYKKDADTFVHKLSELGYVLAIASTTKRSNIDVYRHQNSNIISKADIDTYFKLVLTREDAVAMKPSPDIYLKCLDLLGADVEECIVLEDSLVGVEAAKAAGLTTVGVYDKYSDGDRYEISKLADFTVNEYSERIEMLEHL